MDSVLQHLVYKGCHADIRFDQHDMTFVGEIVNTIEPVSFKTDRADDIESAFHRCVDKYLDFYQSISSATKASWPSLISGGQGQNFASNVKDEITHDDILREYKNAVEATKVLSECSDVSIAVRAEARRQYLMYKAGYEALLHLCRGCIHSSPLPPCKTEPMDFRQGSCSSSDSTSRHKSSYTGACAGDCPSSTMIP